MDPDSPKQWDRWIRKNPDWTRKHSDCKCCFHQQKLAAWKRKEWCKPECIYAGFPEMLHVEWAVMQRCVELRPFVIAGGMGGSSTLEPVLSVERFRLQMEMGEIPKWAWESIWEAIDGLFGFWQKYKDGKVPFGDAEVSELRELAPIAEVVEG